MVSKIAVVLLDAEHAMIGLKQTVSLAERAAATLHLIDVTPPTPGWLRRATSGVRATDEDAVGRRRAMLEDLVSNVRPGDVAVTVAVRRGRRIVEVIREVDESGCRLLVLVAPPTTRSPSTTEAFINRAARKSPTDVCVLRPPIPHRSGTLAAVDISPRDRRLASRILALVGGITPTGDDVQVVHVLEVAEDWEEESPRVEEDVRREMSERRRALEELLDSAGAGGDVHLDVVAGEPVERIEHLVRVRRPALVAVGTVSDAETEGALLGNTAEALLRELECSMLLVKPPGFHSPLGQMAASVGH